MGIVSYLESRPLSGIAKYEGGPPKNALPFTGYPRQHPSERHKVILFHDPLGTSPTILEFRLEDVLLIEELHSAVTESGEGVPLAKLWVRRGAHGVIMEPFEVDDPLQFMHKHADLRERFLQNRSGG
ncbi:MAG: hypothetical protein LBP23_00365 [Treponema sp.]|nr:hypothetical protein [Treponema sp.]